MSTMSVGRRVHYVMRDRQCRPFDVVRVWSDDLINGIVLLDGSNDKANMPWAQDSGSMLHWWATSVKEDATDKNMGTWHWPEKEGE
jgi:hypothetical protein